MWRLSLTSSWPGAFTKITRAGFYAPTASRAHSVLCAHQIDPMIAPSTFVLDSEQLQARQMGYNT